MKLVTFFLLVCFSMNVLAQPLHQLESSFNNYNYALTVEWDQKDKKFHQQKTEEFQKEVAALMLYEGITQKDILDFVEKKVSNKEVVEAIKLQVSLSPNMSTEELAGILSQYSKDFYNRGASWIGDVDWGTVGIVAGITVLVGFVVWFSLSYDCVRHEFVPKYDCDSSNCYEKRCAEYVRK